MKMYLIGIYKGILPILVGLAFIFYVGYLAWSSLGPQKPEADENRKAIADQAIQELTDKLYKERGETRTAVLLHFSNDPTDYFSKALRKQLDNTGILNLEDRTFLEKVRTMLNLRIRGTSSQEDALKAAKGAPVQAVLWGKLERFESTTAGSIVTGSWQLVDLKSGKLICEGEILKNSMKTEAAENKEQAMTAMAGTESTPVERTASSIPWYVRFLGFLLVTLLLPVMSIGFIRTMVARRSNRINAFMLGLYTVIDAIFAFFMVGAAFSSGLCVFAFLVATVLALCYNCYLMCYALKLES